jgi:hypothetical protein
VLVVAGGQSTPVLEPVEAALDDVAVLVVLGVEPDGSAALGSSVLAVRCWSVFSGITTFTPRARRLSRCARAE